jgi:MATE family multidrug resistance protein
MKAEQGHMSAEDPRVLDAFVNEKLNCATASSHIFVVAAPLCEAPSSPSAGFEDELSWSEGVWMLAAIAFPAVGSQFLTIAAQMISILFAGNYLGADAITAVSVSVRFMGITGYKPGMGCACALDTLCTQEHGRDANSKLHGEHFQRSLIPHAVVLGVCGVLYMLSPLYMKYFFDTSLVWRIVEFTQFGVLYIAPLLVSSSLIKTLQAQGHATIPMLAAGCSVIACVPLNFLLVSFGMRGAFAALAATAWVQLLAMGIMALRCDDFRRRYGAWRSFTSLVRDKEGMREYLGLGVPSAGVVVAETVPFAAVALMAGMLGGVEGSAYTVVYTVISLLFTTSYGMSGAAAARIGNALGANKPHRARKFTVLAFVMTLVIACCNIVFLWQFHKVLYQAFAPGDGEVLDRCGSIWLISAAVHMCDCLQFVYQGIYSACGKNHVGFIVVCVCLVGLSTTLASILAFATDFGAAGLLAGLGSGLLIAIPTFTVVVRRTFDWNQMALVASQTRAERNKVQKKR